MFNQYIDSLGSVVLKFVTKNLKCIQTFSLGADGMGATIFLRDASGMEFKTSNTPVVSAVMTEIQTTLDVKIQEVEAQIKF